MQLSYDYAKDRALMCLRANYESHLRIADLSTYTRTSRRRAARHRDAVDAGGGGLPGVTNPPGDGCLRILREEFIVILFSFNAKIVHEPHDWDTLVSSPQIDPKHARAGITTENTICLKVFSARLAVPVLVSDLTNQRLC